MRLADLLGEAGVLAVPMAMPAPRLNGLPPEFADDIVDLYRSLGGKQLRPVLRPGAWDLAIEGDVLIELDEELHFNRYRLATLKRGWTRALPWREAYLGYCDAHEGKCTSAGSWGKRWTNPSCESMFGVPGPAGDLAGDGAPRWKQRALYDAMKDAHAAANGVRLARLSVHDRIGDLRLGDILEGAVFANMTGIADLARARTS
jgi:hypothetical protein